jgi:hypothetical protein
MDCGGASICAHRRVRSQCKDCKRRKACRRACRRRRRLAAVIGCSACMRTRRTTRRAQLLEAHAVGIGALISALARLIPRRCRQMRLAAGPPACICRVFFRAHTIARTTAHTGTCSGARTCARTCARLPMSTCATSHTHTAPLSHALGLAHLCAHAHMHMNTHSQTDGITHRYGIPQERHTQTHTCTHMHTRTHTQLAT